MYVLHKFKIILWKFFLKVKAYKLISVRNTRGPNSILSWRNCLWLLKKSLLNSVVGIFRRISELRHFKRAIFHFSPYEIWDSCQDLMSSFKHSNQSLETNHFLKEVLTSPYLFVSNQMIVTKIVFLQRQGKNKLLQIRLKHLLVNRCPLLPSKSNKNCWNKQ